MHNNGVLLVRLDAIGDFILWLDSAKEYRRLYPGEKITLYANSAWSDLAKLLPYWDRVVPVDVHLFSKRTFYRWKSLFNIGRFGFDISTVRLK